MNKKMRVDIFTLSMSFFSSPTLESKNDDDPIQLKKSQPKKPQNLKIIQKTNWSYGLTPIISAKPHLSIEYDVLRY